MICLCFGLCLLIRIEWCVFEEGTVRKGSNRKRLQHSLPHGMLLVLFLATSLKNAVTAANDNH